ncbi:TIR domain-containing protein [Micromonospora sp. CA-259024]|uniref:TIR domain-containing protein n=1 Tax=Micromonospora sp. CA-259024 TaxID=3239965 RepID=UPI003D8B8AEE
MSTSGPICFWSYTHRDNELENGRIRRLADSIANEYELLTGEQLELFVDSSAVAWGQKWRDVIDDALARTAFFIPVITPLYLRSRECRKEFVEFSARANSVGANDLVMPILYSETPAVADEHTDDEIAVTVRATQQADWRQLRLAEEHSERYRTKVHALAKRLVEVMESESARPLPAIVEVSEEEMPGFLEEVATAEESVESWQGTLEAVWAELQEIMAATEKVGARLGQPGSNRASARERLIITQQYAAEIAEPSAKVRELGNNFFRSVAEAEPGVRSLIEKMHLESQVDGDADEVNSFTATVRGLADSVGGMASQIEGFLEQLQAGDSLSRALRKPLGHLRGGMKAIADTHAIVEGWATMAESGSNAS